MGLNIYWRYVRSHRKDVKTDTPSRFLEIIPAGTQLDSTNLEYLAGLRDAGVQGVAELMEAITSNPSPIVIEVEA